MIWVSRRLELAPCVCFFNPDLSIGANGKLVDWFLACGCVLRLYDGTLIRRRLSLTVDCMDFFWVSMFCIPLFASFFVCFLHHVNVRKRAPTRQETATLKGTKTAVQTLMGPGGFTP